MLTSRQRVPGAARAATRLFSATASSSATPPPSRGGRKSTASQPNAKSAQKAKAPSQAAPQQDLRPPASPQQLPGYSPWLDLLSRSPYLRDHPKYQEVVETLSQQAAKDLGRKGSLEFVEDGRKTTIESGRPLNPDAARQLLLNIGEGMKELNRDKFHGLPIGMGDELQALQDTKRRKEIAEELGEELPPEQPKDASASAAAEDTDKQNDEIARRMEEDEDEDSDPDEDPIPSPFLEGEDQRKFNPLDIQNIDAEPSAMSAVGFKLISIQRQFIHYMRLIEGDMFMLQGLRQQFRPPTEKNPLIVRTTSYGHERHPVTRKRTITTPVALLPLISDAATHKIRLLAGPRWSQRPPTDSGVSKQEDALWGFHGYIKISCEDFPEPVQNLKFASDTLDKLVDEANSLEDFMTDIPLDERHVAAFYKRKRGFDRFGHRASLDDFPVDWLHIPAEVQENLAEAEAEIEEHLYDDERLDRNVPVALESFDKPGEFNEYKIDEEGEVIRIRPEIEELRAEAARLWLESDDPESLDLSEYEVPENVEELFDEEDEEGDEEDEEEECEEEEDEDEEDEEEEEEEFAEDELEELEDEQELELEHGQDPEPQESEESRSTDDRRK